MPRFLPAAIAAVAIALPAHAQSGPWARYDAKMKGEALVREADGGALREVQSIVEGGGDVNWAIAPTGLTPLMAAASAGHADVVRFLLAKGANAKATDSNGRTALDRAMLVGAADVAQLLRAPAGEASTPAPVPLPAPAAAPAAPTSATRWAPFGTYRVGDAVLFFAGSWKPGRIKELGPAAPSAPKQVTIGLRKYLIAPDASPTWPDWVEYGRVVAPARAPFWTGFFVGDWTLGETMAHNVTKEGNDRVDTFSYGAARDALHVDADGTYAWRPAGGPVVRGRWTPAPDGPGIVLVKALRDRDWTFRNETNGTEENIRALESGRLATPGVMSVRATRPMPR